MVNEALSDLYHPLIRLIEQCLHNDTAQRPNISDAMHQFEEVRGDQDNIKDLCEKLIKCSEWLQISAN